MSGHPTLFRQMRVLLSRPRIESDPPRTKALEWRIIQSYVWVLCAPQDSDGQKTCSLARHGAYDVRLIEPSQMPQGDTIAFWIELYDNQQRSTLDSFGNDDLEEAATAADALITEAKMLHGRSASR
jgi:hypothetical protein